MTAEAFAALVDARPSGRGRWIARCPAHPDRRPSLSIATGSDGRTLLRCWAGCATGEILPPLGLSWRDLFPTEGPLTSAERTLIAEERRRREEARRAQTQREREAADAERHWGHLADELGRRLVKLSEGNPERLRVARAWHSALASAREARSSVGLR